MQYERHFQLSYSWFSPFLFAAKVYIVFSKKDFSSISLLTKSNYKN